MTYLENLQHFVTIVVDNLDSNFAGFGPVKRATHRAVKTAPCGLVNIGP